MKNHFVINNGVILTPEKNFSIRSIELLDGEISSIGDFDSFTEIDDAEIIDATGGYVSPGFIDTHTQGGFGYDFSEITLDGFSTILSSLPKFGTTSILATIIPTGWDTLRKTISLIKENLPQINGFGTKLIGLHLEGPYLNPKMMYTMPEEFFSPNEVDEFYSIVDESDGLIKLVTLAPELENMDDIINYLLSKGIVISLGHSTADGNMAIEAFNKGVTRVAHIYNGMTPLHHRDIGMTGAALSHHDIVAEMILDGHHVSKQAAQIAYGMKGKNKIVLMTDSNQILGLPEGEYIRPINRRVIYKDGQIRDPNTNRLAGSALSMDKAFKNSIEFLNVDPFTAAQLSSSNAVKDIHADDIGTIELGKKADLVILDRNYKVMKTIINGNLVYSN